MSILPAADCRETMEAVGFSRKYPYYRTYRSFQGTGIQFSISTMLITGGGPKWRPKKQWKVPPEAFKHRKR